MPQLTRFQRELVSRGARVVLALVFFVAGDRCRAKANEVQQAHVVAAERRATRSPERKLGPPRSGGAAVLDLAGTGLWLVGGLFALMALVPAETFARIVGPPTGTTLWDNPGFDKARRWLR